MQQINFQLVVLVSNQLCKKIMKNAIQHLSVAIALSVAIITSSCVTTYSGETVKEDRALANFSSIQLAIPADLYLSQGDTYSFTIEGDKDFLSEVITEVKGSSLVIKTEGWVNFGWRNLKVKVFVTMPEVNGLTVSGSGDIRAQTPIATENLSVRVSGSGDVNISNLTVRDLDVAVSGSGDVKLSGKGSAGDASVKVTGSGDVALHGIEFNNAEVSISGSGDAYLVASQSLKARVVGSGDIVYSGNPLVDGKVSGSGRIRNK
jgi:hypothetical protein